MADLTEGGVILYMQTSEFLQEYDTNISKGGFFLDAHHDWPVQTVRAFTIEIVDAGIAHTLKAKILYCGEGKVGLEIERSPGNLEAFEEFVLKLRPDSWEPAPSRASRAPSSRETPDAGQVEAASDEPESEEDDWVTVAEGAEGDVDLENLDVTGQYTTARIPDELKDIRPVPLAPTSIAAISLFKLLTSIHAAQAGVALVLPGKKRALTFCFNEKGNLVQLVGTGVDRALLDRLVDGHLITPLQQDEVERELGEGKSAEIILVNRKLVKLRDVWGSLRDLAVEELEGIRSAGPASFRLTRHATGRKTGVPGGSLVARWLDKVLADLPRDEFDALVSPLLNTFPHVRDNPPWEMDKLALNNKGLAFVDEYLNGKRTLTDAIDIYPTKFRDVSLRVVLVLQAMGVLALPSRPRLEEGEQDPESMLAEKLADLQKADLFTQAGVHWSAHPNSYPSTMKRLETAYGPKGKLGRLSPQAQALCQQRLKLAAEAQQLLRNPDLRLRVRQETIGEYQMKVSAQLLFQQAEFNRLKQDFQKAREMLEVAIELDPQAEYKAKLRSLGG